MVQVRKRLGVRRGRNNRLEVLGEEYAYHAWRRGTRRTARMHLFRYDNAHGGLETLHLHCFNTDGDETHIEPVEIDALPRLDLIIRYAVELANVYLPPFRGDALTDND